MKHAWPNTLSQSTIAHWRSMLGSIGLALAIGLSVMLWLWRPAHATSGAVTNCTNDTQLTQLLGGGGSITFNCNNVNDPATIVFSGQKIITQSTSINGGGVITLSGGGVTRIFSVPVGSQLTLANINLIHGAQFNGHGGAILNAGRLIASNVLFYNNVATGTAYVGGGAIRATGALTLTASRFVSNTAKGPGGAIWIDDASGLVPVFISATTFYSNTSFDWGGALDNDGGDPVIIVNSVFQSNASTHSGGGAIDSDSTGALIIKGSRFFDNVGPNCCGAIYSNSILTMTDSAIYSNTSRLNNGGLFLFNTSVLSNVAVYSNTAGGQGGGIYPYAGQIEIYNSTIANNSASIGGGLYVYTEGVTVTLINVTLFGNTVISSGGNISGPVIAVNTIIANGSPNNCGRPITSLGHNLESSNSCGLTATGDMTNRNPLLLPLANYGGPTWSMLPMPDSPAINHGSNAVCPPTDQRGITRPNGGVCDIGAVEFNLTHSIYLPLILKNF